MPELISKVKEFYAAFSRGDIRSIVSSVADSVSWEVQAPPEIHSSGIRHSPHEVLGYFQAIDSQGKDHHLEMTEFFESDDAVASFGRYQGIVRATGIQIDIPMAHYFKFQGGKVVRFVQISDTGTVMEALRGRAVTAEVEAAAI